MQFRAVAAKFAQHISGAFLALQNVFHETDLIDLRDSNGLFPSVGEESISALSGVHRIARLFIPPSP